MKLDDKTLELHNRHKKLSKELINCIAREMAIQRQLNLIEYKIDLVSTYEDFLEESKSQNEEDK